MVSLTISYTVVNTAAGSNVPVEPVDTTTGQPSPLDLNFSNVTGGGTTTVASSTHGPPPPNGFKIGTPPTYYDISTTATFSGVLPACRSNRSTMVLFLGYSMAISLKPSILILQFPFDCAIFSRNSEG